MWRVFTDIQKLFFVLEQTRTLAWRTSAQQFHLALLWQQLPVVHRRLALHDLLEELESIS
jgi:hypothetical protein